MRREGALSIRADRGIKATVGAVCDSGDGLMRVLIVEDDMVVAGSIGPLVTEAGHDLVGLAADRDTAVALLNSASVHLALVDLRLGDGRTGLDVVRAAVKNGAAAVIMTANPSLPTADLAGAAGLVEKPYTHKSLRAVLDFFCRAPRGNGRRREARLPQAAGLRAL